MLLFKYALPRQPTCFRRNMIMNKELQDKIELFASNRKIIGDAFKLDYGLNYIIASLLLTEMGIERCIELQQAALDRYYAR